MSRPDDNLFDLDDYVPPGGGLPEHLRGKSAEEVAQYYSGVLRTANERTVVPPTPPARTPASGTPPPAPPAPLTAEDVAPALGTMIQSARMVARANLPTESQALWDRFSTDIETIMKAGFKGIQLADAQNWVFAYNQVLGSKASLLMKETRDAEISRRTAESSSSTNQAPPAEITLEPIHEELASGLGLSKDQFKHGIQTMREDKWPMTFSNRP